MTNCFAMPETTIPGCGLERVAHRVSKVQNASRAMISAIGTLAFIAGDNRSFESALRFDHGFKLGKAERTGLCLSISKKLSRLLEQLPRSNDPVLYRFTPTSS